jgi:hypothetical protein
MMRARCAALIALVVAVGILLPPLVYAGLAYWKFGFLKVTWYEPHEELLEALRGGTPAEIFAAPLFAANMTSGSIIANMFSLRVGELLLSLVLGIILGLNLLAHARLHSSCAVRGGPAMAVATASGLASTLAASSTGILGCCGPAFSGGLLALAGLSATASQSIALASPAAQGAIIAALALNYARLRRLELRAA